MKIKKTKQSTNNLKATSVKTSNTAPANKKDIFSQALEYAQKNAKPNKSSIGLFNNTRANAIDSAKKFINTWNSETQTKHEFGTKFQVDNAGVSNGLTMLNASQNATPDTAFDATIAAQELQLNKDFESFALQLDFVKQEREKLESELKKPENKNNEAKTQQIQTEIEKCNTAINTILEKSGFDLKGISVAMDPNNGNVLGRVAGEKINPFTK